MVLNLKQIGSGVGYDEKKFDFSHNLDLSSAKLWGEHVFSKPVQILGQVSCRNGIFTINYTSTFEINGSCSRCLAPINRQCQQEFEHILLEEIEDEDESAFDNFILAPNGELDLDELATSDLLLECSGVLLCDENCKGLCPKCGKNNNDGICDCKLVEPDSRFDVLRKLLEE